MTEERVGLKGIFWLSILLVASFASLAFGAEDRITSELKITPLVKLNKNEQRALSLAASEIVSHVEEARVDIKYNAGKNAPADVEKCLLLVKIIDLALPEYSVSTHIKADGLTYNQEEKRKQYIVPMHGEFDRMFPMGSAIWRAKREAREKESVDAEGAVELPYTTSFLDVRDARYYLEQAEDAFRKGDTQKADKALASIQEHVNFEYDLVGLQLETAQRNIWQAAKMAAAKNYERAKQALSRAGTALEVYKKQAGNDAAKEVDSILDEMKKATEKLDEKKQGAVDTINNLWDRVTNLF